MIVSTTLTGDNADVIGDALRSVVDHVDKCIVIDTRQFEGAHNDTLEVAGGVCGDKFVVVSFPWVNDFSKARNYALECATKMGADWAITVDTDERLVFDEGFNLAHALKYTKSDVMLVSHADRSYSKERIVRIPTYTSWYGPTHECLGGQTYESSSLLEGMTFWELNKTPEQTKVKYARDIALLTEYSKARPDETRWHYYLGSTLQDTEHWEEAAEAFLRCAKLMGWDEEGAWACYRAAECYTALKRWKDAVVTCAFGLAIRPGTAELAWLAGWSEYSMGNFEKAIAWCNMSIANGLYSGTGSKFKRIGFKNQFALHDGPFDVLHWSYLKLGDEKAAAIAKSQTNAAKLKRERRAR